MNRVMFMFISHDYCLCYNMFMLSMFVICYVTVKVMFMSLRPAVMFILRL
jgi:hypothetical protein